MVLKGIMVDEKDHHNIKLWAASDRVDMKDIISKWCIAENLKRGTAPTGDDKK